MKKRIKYFILMIFTFLIFQPNVFAASLSIWANASNVTVGKTVTISVNAKDMGGSFNVTSSNNAVLSGGVTGKWLESDTYTFTFTAKSVGKATITVTPIDVATNDSEPVPYTTSKSVTLNVVAKSSSSGSGGSTSGGSSGGTTADKKEYSNDNSLKSLSIDGQKLSPEFKKDVTEYKLTVDESVEKLNVVAKANHEKASVSGAGEITLSSGANTIEVKVTAENGNEKKYTIIVTVEDQNPISVKIGNDTYTIVKKNNNLIEKLEYYEEGFVQIDNQNVVSYVNSKTKVTLVLLKDKDNKIGYYIYNKVDKSYAKYDFITVNGVTLQLLSSKEKLEHYKKYTIQLQDKNVTIYRLKKSHKVGLIYGTNVKTGNTGYYVYDQNEEVLSKYFDDEVKIYQDEVQELKNYLMIFMGGVSFVVILVIVVSLCRGVRKRNRRKGSLKLRRNNII